MIMFGSNGGMSMIEPADEAMNPFPYLAFNLFSVQSCHIVSKGLDGGQANVVQAMRATWRLG